MVNERLLEPYGMGRSLRQGLHNSNDVFLIWNDVQVCFSAEQRNQGRPVLLVKFVIVDSAVPRGRFCRECGGMFGLHILAVVGRQT